MEIKTEAADKASKGRDAGCFLCDRRKSECHRKRVRRWLDEIKRLEGQYESNV